MKSSKVFTVLVLFLLTVSFIACSAVPQQNLAEETGSESEEGTETPFGQKPPGETGTESEEGTERSSGQKPLDVEEPHPYLSITYAQDNPDNFTGLDMVFYTYDIVTGELEEHCVIPFDSQYACGLVSKVDNKVYYSSRSEPNTLGVCDGLWVYDIETGEFRLLETQNWTYNDIIMIRPGRLLVMASTKEHPIIPALFDLESHSFIYMPEANGEPFDLYSCGASEIFYSGETHEMVCIYQNEDEAYMDEYRNNEEPINTYIAVASEDMVKDPERTFAISLKVEDQVMSAVQISENELRVVICHVDLESFAWGGDLNMEYRQYSLVFQDGKSTLTPVGSLDLSTSKWGTIDGGKTFYFLRQSEEEPKRGLYSYCAETGEITPILLGDPETNGHVVSYTILNP